MLTLIESDCINFLVFLSDLKYMNACKKDNSQRHTDLVGHIIILLLSELKDLVHKDFTNFLTILEQ